MRLISLPEWAALIGVNRQRALVLVKSGRVLGAVQIGRAWAVPADALKPAALPAGVKPGRRRLE